MKNNNFNNKTNTLFSFLGKINWLVYFSLILLTLIGSTILFSVSQGNFYPLVSSHLIKFLISSMAFFIVCLMSINFFYKFSYLIYLLSIILLLLVLFLGNDDQGANRWIYLAGFTFQPSELSKIAVVLCLSRYYHDYQLINHNNLLKVLFPILIIFMPVSFVLNQPDLGTALLILISSLSVIFLSGIGLRYIIGAIIFVGLSAPVIWNFLYQYQKQRIITFINPEQDPLGSGYHIAQSKIAIGSGGVLGKGYTKGSQSHLEFIPEMHTDFVFSIFSEEFGFLGSLILMTIYSYIIYYGIKCSYKASKTFSKLAISGLTINIFLYFIINISMVVGLIPVVGVPLPLVSYGGSSMLVTMISFGLIMSLNRFTES